MSPLWILLELRMMKVVVTTGTIRLAELQSNRHYQQINVQLFYRQWKTKKVDKKSKYVIKKMKNS